MLLYVFPANADTSNAAMPDYGSSELNPRRRWMYANSFRQFCADTSAQILGQLTRETSGDLDHAQKSAWESQIAILKSVALPESLSDTTRLYLELSVPRLGRRVDVAMIAGSILFIIEFKVGERSFTRSAKDQVLDYALDFRHFHDASHEIAIVPILVPTDAPPQPLEFDVVAPPGIPAEPVLAAATQISQIVALALERHSGGAIDAKSWELGRYLPTPTIVEAARALYAGHSVAEISRHDAGAKNLQSTVDAIEKIIRRSREHSRKSICFLTGVPGAGKTLVGLDVAVRHMDSHASMYSVFLSGNGPLVAVLREALVRDRVDHARSIGNTLRKGDARQKVEVFIQNVHHFRDECLRSDGPPAEHVVLFDEAQRAWNREQTSSFMRKKKGALDFDESEPAFLISCLDRHPDWAVVVCMVGSGQEINTGEAGISEWLEAVLSRYAHWDVYLSPGLFAEDNCSVDLRERTLVHPRTVEDGALHLETSMRSFRTERLSAFVKQVLTIDHESARRTLQEMSDRYPLAVTRDLTKAKSWLRSRARGTERYGIVVSSQAERLKPHAIDVRVKTDPVKWFLDGKDDVRSCYYLEEVATEFQVQGLELDWVCVVWDADLRYAQGRWEHREFRGTKWIRIHKPERQRYLENAYRVLLTRARQGMVVVVPEGDAEDPTRAPGIYDDTYRYLRSLGIDEI